MPLHHKRSLERINHITPSVKTKISLHAGDAVYRQETISWRWTGAVSRQSFHQLLPNGRIALADICFSNAPPMNPWARLMRRVLKLMPQENAISIDDYIRCLEQIGYEDVKVEDVSEDVFPGFVAFLKSRGLGWWLFGFVMYQYYSAGARFVIASASRFRKE
ncbi:hypothetical protein FB446DRAFT_776540 [Lentinula raphanica]|nr:hypothetical protein FB446DRAFT_776540 [Lentinula raphanica]